MEENCSFQRPVTGSLFRPPIKRTFSIGSIAVHRVYRGFQRFAEAIAGTCRLHRKG